MDLRAASWEVIGVTRRAIGGLVPDLSGDGGRISSSAHFASSHRRPSPAGEGRLLISGGRGGPTVAHKVATPCTYISK